jgi:hypothetical protein
MDRREFLALFGIGTGTLYFDVGKNLWRKNQAIEKLDRVVEIPNTQQLFLVSCGMTCSTFIFPTTYTIIR